MINKMETLMFQGNGYFGMRAAAEEHQLNERRNMFVSGTFDAFPSEVTELPSLPDLINMEIKIDGQALCLRDGQVENYHKYLNMKNGELIREFDWIINHKRINFKFSRFISMQDKHLMVSKVEIGSDRDDLNIKIRSGIDGQQSNSETQHLMEGDKRLYEGTFIQLKEETQQSHIKFVFNVRHRAYIDEVLLNNKPFIKMGRRQIFGNYDVDLNKGQKFTLVKYANVYTSIDSDVDNNDLAELSVNALKKNCLSNYQELLQKSEKIWNKDIWQKNYVEIDSDDINPQVAINFARYQMAANTPRDPRMNIGAKGITGEGYKGHTFWDTEIFMLPYYIFTMPNVARNLLKYRYLGLEGAHKKAQFNDYDGSQFPWEAAWPSDGETAPLWGSADIVTGEPMKIWSGFIEQHVTSDVVIATMEYLSATDDQKFAEDMGYEIILDAAKFWTSRLEYDQDHDRYEITDVIGPDEYKEHADNNAFTNYTAQWCIQKAIKVVNLLKEDHPDLYVKLDDKLNLVGAYEDWVSKVNKIYLPQPNADGVIPEDDKYLSKPIIDLSKYKLNNQISNIFKDYNLSQVNDMQITKQADVLLLIYLFENMFDDDIKRSNWEYYEPKTTHDSSLSLSTHAILANDLKLDESAYNFYEMACETDLGVHIGKSVQGLHMAACGGIWNMTIEGFGGVRITNGKLRIEPHLPATWRNLKFQINWQGSLLKVCVVNDKMSVEVVGDSIEFVNQNQDYQVPANSRIEIEVPVEETVER
ncbi:glycoside hydrolase family 65 central catalytic [Companilactobacillus kimchiensis]|uniref:Glycoside hydrolase family 65 central catalytic n=2 Tax=Companilactobacillus kimchiensis TaxID=993692 RepID=A0A0R2LB44_9LACO|nr:glycoside hydrolase family 65 central catalytic [Companilactobacillus kimchiensis]